MNKLFTIASQFYKLAVKLQMLQNAPENINSEYCSSCGGTCCSGFPGMAHPDQFGPKGAERMRNMLEAVTSGDYDINVDDKISKDEGGNMEILKTYYLRPASRSGGPIGAEPCKFQGSKGCELEHEHRPYGCQTLIPSMDNGKYNCHHPKGSGQELLEAWRKEQPVMNMIRRKLGLY